LSQETAAIKVSHYYRYASYSQNQVVEHEGRFILLVSSMLGGTFIVIFEGILFLYCLTLYFPKHFPRHKDTMHKE